MADQDSGKSGVRPPNVDRLAERVAGLRRDIDRIAEASTADLAEQWQRLQRELDEIRAFIWPPSGLTLREQIAAVDAKIARLYFVFGVLYSGVLLAIGLAKMFM